MEEAASVGRVIFSARLREVLARLQQQRLRLIRLPLREHCLGAFTPYRIKAANLMAPIEVVPAVEVIAELC